MIQHVVLLSLADPSDFTILDQPLRLIEGLVGLVPGLISVTHGPNLDFENKSAAYQYGFVVTCEDRDALASYADHPQHGQAGGMLVAACAGGHEGIFVADLSVGA